MTTDPKWKKFEKLIAALHRTKQEGGKVIWNDIINGRQFDVTIRFKMSYYEYLTIIECKDQSEPVSGSDVEALVTKSSDAKANKAVMVSSSGFQSGAIEVALRHNIELFSASEINEIPEELLSTELRPALNIYDIKFKRKDNENWIVLPEDRNLPEYLLKNLAIKNNYKSIKLNELLEGLQPSVLKTASNEEQVYQHIFRIDTKVYFPHLCEEYAVEKLSFKHKIVSLRSLKEHSPLDPFFLSYKYIYKNELTGEINKIKRLEVESHFDIVLEPGKFYYNPNIESSYYCISVQDDSFDIILVESYQHGELFQCSGRQGIEGQKFYVEITDKNEIERLKKVGHKILSDHGITF